MYIDEKGGIEIIVCVVGKTILHYDFPCIKDLHGLLKKHGDRMLLGSKDEKVDTKDGTVETLGKIAQHSNWWLVWSKKRILEVGLECTYRH